VSRFVLSSHRRMSCIVSANSVTRNLHTSIYIYNEKRKRKENCASKAIVSAIGITPYNHVRSLLEEINTHSINEQTSIIIILIIQDWKGYWQKVLHVHLCWINECQYNLDENSMRSYLTSSLLIREEEQNNNNNNNNNRQLQLILRVFFQSNNCKQTPANQFLYLSIYKTVCA
jgi:hypothetical protein